MNPLFDFNFCWTDGNIITTVIFGFILLVIHAQAVTSVLVFRVYHQFVDLLFLPHLFPYPFQPLNKAVHLSRCVWSMNEVKELRKPAKRRDATRMIISGFKGNIYFIDLIDFYSKLHKSIQEVLGRQKSIGFYKNRGYKYVLVCIDGYSKYLMIRKLKSKSATEVTHAMKDIIQTYGPPKHICSDRGTEFTNAIFRTNIFNKYDITMYHMDSANKAVLAERAIRDIKEHIMVPSFHSIIQSMERCMVRFDRWCSL